MERPGNNSCNDVTNPELLEERAVWDMVSLAPFVMF